MSSAKNNTLISQKPGKSLRKELEKYAYLRKERHYSENISDKVKPVKSSTLSHEIFPPPFSKEVSKSTALFLDEEIAGETQTIDYSLSEEFAKTRKNKNYLFYPVVFGFIIALSLFTYILTQDIQERNRSVEVEIKEFQDLTLADVINQARENQKKLGSLKAELQESQRNLQERLQRIEAEAQQRIALIKARDLSPEEKRKQIAAIQNQYSGRVQNLKSEYEQRIRQKEQEISSIRNRLEQQQQKMETKFARERENILAQKERLHEREMDRLRQSYENRIEKIREQNEKQIRELKEHQKALINQLQENFQKEIAQIKKQNQEFLTFLNEKQRILEKYRYGLTQYTRSRMETGYILDGRNPDKIILILNENYPVQRGDKAVILDNDGNKIALIEITPRENYTEGQILDYYLKKDIEPFFPILIQLKQE
jgi:hypothetical protein